MKSIIISLANFIINILILKNSFEINSVLCKVLAGSICLYSLLGIIYGILDFVPDTWPLSLHLQGCFPFWFPFVYTDLAALSYFHIFFYDTYFRSDTTGMVTIFLLLSAILITIRYIPSINLLRIIPFATNAIILHRVFWLETASNYEKIIYTLAYILFSHVIFHFVYIILPINSNKRFLFLKIFKYSQFLNQIAILIVSIIMKIKLPDTSLFYIIISSIALASLSFREIWLW